MAKSERAKALEAKQKAEARAEIDRAIAYARAIGCGAVHVWHL